jgi:indole-3-glycerol phosphate synthase
MILERIISKKKEEVSYLRKKISLQNLRREIANLPPPRNFLHAVSRERGEPIKLIAEIKKASPLSGIMRNDFNEIEIAKIYKASGASAISIVTDREFFKGTLDMIRDVKEVVDLPILRKDFIIDEYQIYEARSAGADAVLIIAAILSKDEIKGFFELSKELGLHSLVEVHTEEELEKVLDKGVELIGINNRNLRTFEVNIDNTLRLRSMIPEGCTVVSESGISTRGEVKLLASERIDAVLIGEGILRSKDIGGKIRELFGFEENELT